MSARLKVDVSRYKNTHSVKNKLGRLLWALVWSLFYSPSPIVFHAWRRMLLRLFGGKIGKGVCPYPSARIWAPWNLEMGEYSCIGHWVDCYCVDKIRIGAHATVSQYSFLCTASHDISDPKMALITAPIEIADSVWICADVFVGPGVTVNIGAVVGARSSVYKDVPPWTVVAGNPVRLIKKRILRQ